MRAAACEISLALFVVVPSRMRSPVKSASETCFASS
jgi:hypothetical protein